MSEHYNFRCEKRLIAYSKLRINYLKVRVRDRVRVRVWVWVRVRVRG